MPAAIFPIVVTKVHHGDMPTALRVVLGTSIIGLITTPLRIGFGLHWIIPSRHALVTGLGIAYCFLAL